MVRYRFGWIVGIAMIAVFLCSGVAMAETGKIDINKASVEELTTLEGIGPQRARAIVDHRENHGPFRTPVDLTNVSGIGPRTFEAIKDRIGVSVPESAGLETVAEKPETGKIDINTATVEELATLEGIGLQRAQAIVDHRDNNGLFRTPVDLTNIPGIGPRVFEANRDRITVSVPAAAGEAMEKPATPQGAGSGTAAEKPETAQ